MTPCERWTGMETQYEGAVVVGSLAGVFGSVGARIQMTVASFFTSAFLAGYIM